MDSITLNELLSGFNPCHTIESGVMLLSRFSCGCVVTLTFGGRPKGKKHNYFWFDNGQCSKDHRISDLSECDTICSKIGAVYVATEIKIANTIKVSMELSK